MQSIMVAKEDGVVLLDLELDPSRSYSLGRSPNNDIQLDAPSISRLHAVIYHHGKSWWISDLGSARGIRSEEGPVTQAELKDGTWIALGPAFVWYRDDQSDSGSDTKSQAPAESAPYRKLNILMIECEDEDGELDRHLFALDERKAVTLGGSELCDISIAKNGLEPLELLFFRVRATWHVTGMSQNQLKITGERVQSSALEPGTRIRSGPLVLSLQEGKILPKIPHLTRSGKGKREPNDGLSVDSVDLDAAAREGRSDGPERPNST